MSLVADVGFAHRLAYIRWLLSRGRINPASDKELATALGVGYKWIGKWKVLAESPEGRTELAAITKALVPMGVSADWLYDGKGPVPRLWPEWIAAESVAQPIPLPPVAYKKRAEAATEPVAKRASAKRGRKGA